jgi:23S rRNA (uracil1939-C5)-methyltransferase
MPSQKTPLLFEGRVRSMSSDGQGVVEAPDGCVYFVKGVWVGDFAQFRIIKKKKRYGFAELIELLQASPSRREAPCAHFGWQDGSCGGCAWQLGTYASQLEQKQIRVSHALQKASLPAGDDVLCLIRAAEREWGYRNRAQFKTDGQELGYVSSASHILAPIKDCLVLSEVNRQHLKSLRAQLPSVKWKPHRGERWNSIDVDEEMSIDQIQLNKRRAFKQANTSQNLFMKKWVAEKIQNWPRSSAVLELFAGSGNFTEIFVSESFKNICAVELVEEALETLRLKKWPSVTLVASDLFSSAAYVGLKQKFARADYLFLDPPRDGLKDKQALLEAYPSLKEIIYVSCDLATFVRDAQAFQQAGFSLLQVQPVDQFPQTPHIEILSIFRKNF